METWAPIPDYDGYEVSDLGRIRSWWQKGVGNYRRETPKLLCGSVRSGDNPYLRVTLTVRGVKSTEAVHLLVITSFRGPAPDGMWALHNDGNSFNNELSNLRWGTPEENAKDRAAHGRTLFGERNHKAKLDPIQVDEIRSRYVRGQVRQADLAADYGVTQETISSIVRGASWSHIPMEEAA